ncbi:hypothetical protein TNCV_2734051 [Trichonephila clavipes]|nr:hypothetical protein TNCV_2734051 [Trichonephila clavipes]
MSLPITANHGTRASSLLKSIALFGKGMLSIRIRVVLRSNAHSQGGETRNVLGIQSGALPEFSDGWLWNVQQKCK